MRTAGLLLVLAVFALSSDPRGIPPRPDVRLYRSALKADNFELGATLMTQEQAKNTFYAELSRTYVVIEAGVYPKENREVDLKRSDFALRAIQSGQVARAADPLMPIKNHQTKAPSRLPVDVYGSTGIGYESGSVYDPVTGRRRNGGVYTSTGVGVGTGTGRPYPPDPGKTDNDRDQMEQDARDKELPQGITTKPVAGFLFFPLASKKKDETYELTYDGPSGTQRVNVGRR